MVAGLNLYFSRYARPHLKAIATSPQLGLSIVVGTVIGCHSDTLKNYATVDVSTILANYNFMVFGFTIAALTIVFAVPTQRFIDFLVESERRLPASLTGPWEKALFIMSWNGIVHFLALILALTTLLVGFDYTLAEKSFVYNVGAVSTKVVFSILATVQVYALLQFLSSLTSTYFFCAVFVSHSKNILSSPQDSNK